MSESHEAMERRPPGDEGAALRWPVKHPLLAHSPEGHWLYTIHPSWCKARVPDDIAYELNKWATVQACHRMIAGVPNRETLRKYKYASDWSSLRRDDLEECIVSGDDAALIKLHARLVKATA